MTPPIYSTHPIRPDLWAVLEKLQPGQKIKITQLVRVGMKTWPAVVTGTFRHLDSLATGLATQRLPEDDEKSSSRKGAKNAKKTWRSPVFFAFFAPLRELLDFAHRRKRRGLQ